LGLPQLRHQLLFDDLETFAVQLGQACRVADGGAGCLMLTDLPKELNLLHEELVNSGREFFALSVTEKEEVGYQQSAEFRGYMRQGSENTAGRVDEREQLEFGREEARPMKVGQLYHRLRGPNQWPSRPKALKPLMLQWLKEMEDLSRQLTRALSLSLGLTSTRLDEYFLDAPHVQAKMVHYPPGPGGDGMGVGAHCDSGFLTLLWQDSSGGLEFLDAHGRWLPAIPQPASLVCNLGEVVQLLTGGVYPATVHRVLRPKHAAGRISLPYFWNPTLDAKIQTLDLQQAVAELRGRPSASENKMMLSYGMNAFKSLARSHPTVFARHHPDLKCLPDGSVVYKDG